MSKIIRKKIYNYNYYVFLWCAQTRKVVILLKLIGVLNGIFYRCMSIFNNGDVSVCICELFKINRGIKLS